MIDLHIHTSYSDGTDSVNEILKKENIYFICFTILKPEVIIECSKHFNILLSKMVLVDDRLDVFKKSGRIRNYCISS